MRRRKPDSGQVSAKENPIMSFDSYGLDARLLKAVQQLGFEQPTPIQRLAIPPLMEGRDLLAAAATGSGKTAAFLLPILHRLLDKPRGVTRVLILAPTRELAAQITEHMHALARHTPLKGAAVFGGVGMAPQENALRRGYDVIVATPGRLLDHMQHPYVHFEGLEVLVLDEGDRMLDMGFLPDIRRILEQLPAKRQTLLCSATLPMPIVELAQEMLNRPAAINIERKSAPAHGITHVAYPVPHELKSKLLLELLRRGEAKSVLAFTRTKHRANRLADFLEKRGVPVGRIHGSRSQAQRTDALAGFKKGRFRVLVATDIAARGLDVEDLALVVNFDVPNLPEDYIHRVGRTARADATGDAFTLVSPNEEGDLKAIERHIGKPLPREKVQGFDYESKPEERFEVPIAERIAAIRARKAEERARAKAKVERRAAPQDAKREGAALQGGRHDIGAAQGGRRQGPAPGKIHRGGSRPAPSGAPHHRRQPEAAQDDNRGNRADAPSHGHSAGSAPARGRDDRAPRRERKEHGDHRSAPADGARRHPFTVHGGNIPESARPEERASDEHHRRPRGHVERPAGTPAPAHYPRRGAHPSALHKDKKEPR